MKKIVELVTAKKSRREISSEENQEKKMVSKKEKARQHMDQLDRLQQKDPEFFEFLKEHDKDLLQFNDEDIDDEIETDADDDADDDEVDDDSDDEELEKDTGTEDLEDMADEEQGSSKHAITIDMVDSWCTLVQNNASLSAVRSLLRAFRTACHSGDDDGDDSKTKLTAMSSNVFNKIMLFVLNEMDGILRRLLKLPPSGGNKEMLADLMRAKQWKNHSHLVKSYLGNCLHVLNQMTNVEMISFTLRRLRYSSVLLSAFPALLRKYIKVILHYWTGGGALPVISFLFLRDLCMQLGSDCVEECFKGMYKTYVEHCHYVNAANLQHIQFLGNCFIELLRVDLPAAYQHGFVFIRQLAMVLMNAMTNNQRKDQKNDKKQDRKRDVRPEKKKDKELFKKVYEWKYINSLELWTGAVCTHSSEADLRPLAYPLSQIISGVARLVPSAQYFPLRLRCVRMLNRIAASTGTYVPVSLLLIDMLEMKELHRPATGGVGEAVDLRTTLKVSEKNLKTRAFQEACVFSVVEELTEHLAQWSHSIAFFELSFVPAVRLRDFCKSTKVERFRREMRQLIRQIDSNSDFTNKKRMSITFLPNDPAATTFLENEKRAGASPLVAYAETLRQRAQQRTNSLMQSSVLVGERSSAFAKEIVEDDEDDDNSDDDGAAVFNSSWLPGSDSGNKQAKQNDKKKKQQESQQDAASDEDLVEDLVLSDEDDSMDDMAPPDDVKSEQETSNHQSKKRKFSANSNKNRAKHQKSKKRKSPK